MLMRMMTWSQMLCHVSDDDAADADWQLCMLSVCMPICMIVRQMFATFSMACPVNLAVECGA